MACRLFGTKPLPEPMLMYCQFDPQEQTSMKFESKYNTFKHINVLENVVYDMAAILIGVDALSPSHGHFGSFYVFFI